MRGLCLTAAVVLCLLFAGTTAILVTRFEKLRGEQTVFEELAGEAEEVRTYKYSLADNETRLESNPDDIWTSYEEWDDVFGFDEIPG